MSKIPDPSAMADLHEFAHGSAYGEAINTPENPIPEDPSHPLYLIGELPTAAGRARYQAFEVERLLVWLYRRDGVTLYHAGELDRDRVTDPTANTIGHLMLKAAELGLVHLYQQKTEMLYVREYYAKRRPRYCSKQHEAILRDFAANLPPALIPIPPEASELRKTGENR